MPLDRARPEGYQIQAISEMIGDGARANEAIANFLGHAFEA